MRERPRFRYMHHCYDQELFNRLMVELKPRWARFPHVLDLAAFDAAPAEGRSVRLLNYSRWTGINNLKWYAIRVDDRLARGGPRAPDLTRLAFPPSHDTSEWCLLHTMGLKNESTFARHGLWHCDASAHARRWGRGEVDEGLRQRLCAL